MPAIVVQAVTVAAKGLVDGYSMNAQTFLVAGLRVMMLIVFLPLGGHASDDKPEPIWVTRCKAEITEAAAFGTSIVCIDGVTGQSVVFLSVYDEKTQTYSRPIGHARKLERDEPITLILIDRNPFIFRYTLSANGSPLGEPALAAFLGQLSPLLGVVATPQQGNELFATASERPANPPNMPTLPASCDAPDKANPELNAIVAAGATVLSSLRLASESTQGLTADSNELRARVVIGQSCRIHGRERPS